MTDSGGRDEAFLRRFIFPCALSGVERMVRSPLHGARRSERSPTSHVMVSTKRRDGLHLYVSRAFVGGAWDAWPLLSLSPG